jgi:hypothetical protein
MLSSLASTSTTTRNVRRYICRNLPVRIECRDVTRGSRSLLNIYVTCADKRRSVSGSVKLASRLPSECTRRILLGQTLSPASIMGPRSLITFLLALASPVIAQGASGSGRTTRYWDCCKPSCAWPNKAPVSQPILTCSKNDSPLRDPSASSGCDGGSAFACGNNSPFAVNDNVAYGFAATAISGKQESNWCCACYA